MKRRKVVGQKPLIIVVGGGLGREVIWLARECHTPWNVCGVLDDSSSLQGQALSDVKVIGRVRDAALHLDAAFVVAIGAPRVRRAVVHTLRACGVTYFATLVHRSAQHSEFVEIGEGSIVAAGAILTTQVRIGRHVILDRMVNVGHDCRIGDYCTVSPLVPLGGNVQLDDGVWVGASSSVRQGVRMGAGSMAGMGAVVVRDVPNCRLVVGVPARVIKELETF